MFCDQKSKVDTPPHPPKKNNTKKQSNLIMKIIDKTRQSIPSNHFINTTCMKLQKTSTWQNLASRITPEWQLCWEFTSIYFSTKNPKSFSFAAFLHYRYRTLCWAAQKKKNQPPSTTRMMWRNALFGSLQVMPSWWDQTEQPQLAGGTGWQEPHEVQQNHMQSPASGTSLM